MGGFSKNVQFSRENHLKLLAIRFATYCTRLLYSYLILRDAKESE